MYDLLELARLVTADTIYILVFVFLRNFVSTFDVTHMTG